MEFFLYRNSERYQVSTEVFEGRKKISGNLGWAGHSGGQGKAIVPSSTPNYRDVIKHTYMYM